MPDFDGEDYDEIIDAEIIDIDEAGDAIGATLVPLHDEPVDGEIVHPMTGKSAVGIDRTPDGTVTVCVVTGQADGSTHYEIVPQSDMQVGIREAVVLPSPERSCWWRLGPNIRDNSKFAHDYGVLDIIDETDDRHRGMLTLSCKDTTQLAIPVLGWYADWQQIAVDDRSGRTYHSKLGYIDICCQRPPALPNPTPWQQMTRRGEVSYPGTDMRSWTFDNPWDDTPAGFYPHASRSRPDDGPPPISRRDRELPTSTKEIRW